MTQPQAARPLQKLPIPRGQLGHAKTDRGESQAPRRRAVPPRRLHRHESPAPESRRRAVLQQTRDGGAMDQGRQAGGVLDTAVAPPLPANEVRLQLSVLAYNLGNLWRRLVLPTPIDTWSLTSLQQRLVKRGGRLVKHASYYWLLLAESHLTRRLFGSMLRRIWALPCRPADGQRLSRCTAGRRRDSGREKCPKNVVGGRAAGLMPARPKVVTTARSQRQRMLTGAQVRWPIMRLCAATMRSAAGESN
jgi:hypothetical protein